jgi:hypothetical protein
MNNQFLVPRSTRGTDEDDARTLANRALHEQAQRELEALQSGQQHMSVEMPKLPLHAGLTRARGPGSQLSMQAHRAPKRRPTWAMRGADVAGATISREPVVTAKPAKPATVVERVAPTTGRVATTQPLPQRIASRMLQSVRGALHDMKTLDTEETGDPPLVEVIITRDNRAPYLLLAFILLLMLFALQSAARG